MGFLREQMGEEELRHLLEMLSVEAGEQGGPLVCAGMRRVLLRCCAAEVAIALPCAPETLSAEGMGERDACMCQAGVRFPSRAPLHQAAPAARFLPHWQRHWQLARDRLQMLPSTSQFPQPTPTVVPSLPFCLFPPGKDGGIDVTRLMELADDAEEEEANGMPIHKQNSNSAQ